jgi:hypothetical protein
LRAADRHLTLLIVLVASAFGPYLVGGLRVEQIVAYPAAACVAVTGWRGSWWRGRDFLVVAGCIVGIFAVAAVGLMLPKWESSPWGWGSPLANLDNLALPVAVLVAVAGLAHRVGRERALDAATATLAIGCAAMAAVSVVQAIAPGLVSWFLPAFWGEGGTPERALTMGRITGPLGTPALAGAMFTLGVLAVGYAYRNRLRWMLPLLALVTIGGLLTVSKNFLFVGLPVAGLRWLQEPPACSPCRFWCGRLGGPAGGT